jgi:hypothetical protein
MSVGTVADAHGVHTFDLEHDLCRRSKSADIMT